jgi:hypothetical protein
MGLMFGRVLVVLLVCAACRSKPPNAKYAQLVGWDSVPTAECPAYLLTLKIEPRTATVRVGSNEMKVDTLGEVKIPAAWIGDKKSLAIEVVVDGDSAPFDFPVPDRKRLPVLVDSQAKQTLRVPIAGSEKTIAVGYALDAQGTLVIIYRGCSAKTATAAVTSKGDELVQTIPLLDRIKAMRAPISKDRRIPLDNKQTFTNTDGSVTLAMTEGPLLSEVLERLVRPGATIAWAGGGKTTIILGFDELESEPFVRGGSLAELGQIAQFSIDEDDRPAPGKNCGPYADPLASVPGWKDKRPTKEVYVERRIRNGAITIFDARSGKQIATQRLEGAMGACPQSITALKDERPTLMGKPTAWSAGRFVDEIVDRSR